MLRARDLSLTIVLAGFALTGVSALADARAQGAETTPGDDQRAAARQAYDAGTIAFEQSDYATALDSYRKAQSIIASPHTMFWIARSLDQLGRKEEAISAYQELLTHPDAAKIGEEKSATAKERLRALQAPEAAEPAAPAPAATPAEEPAILPTYRTLEDLKPKKNLTELGVLTGPLFISKAHNLQDNRFEHGRYSTLAWQAGLRAAFFPVRVVGFEAEWAHGWGTTKRPESPTAGSGAASASAQFDSFRGHMVGQLANSRFVPFAVLGAGVLRAKSSRLGTDTDFLLELGIGAKYAATKLLMPRLDLRLGMTQKEGGGFSDGVALHPEALLGLSFTLGR